MKIITVCGSLKFKEEMLEIAAQKELAGNCVLIPIFPIDNNKYTEEEINMFGQMHKEKIKLSNEILVVNVNGYIGESTKSEIEFAKSLGKEITYSEELR